MKILVFSDSHRIRSGMLDAVELHNPDQIIHLGDLVEDAEELSYAYPTLPVCIVAGNCDGWVNYPTVKNITLSGKRILLAHGHLWKVKGGYERALAEAAKVKADILLCGHTHIPLCEQREGGLWLMNPGSARNTYGLVTIADGAISCEILKMK